ncbi:MAG TPA: DUF3987 domain-containing protein, partial [Chlamydiales bacterium]|jgi:hypothetical protein|nr:DUF3987 domain-containing protein [Chlamydiales bacterium]
MKNHTKTEEIQQVFLSPDLSMADRFLNLISQSNESTFAFQIFNDRKDVPSSICPLVLCGAFELHKQTLLESQQRGAGVFVTINKTDGKGRKTENITAVRAVFVDLDGSPLEPILSGPLPPHIVVETSPMRYHASWLVNGIDLNLFSIIQKSLIAKFNGDPKVHDLARVMRLPGFYHQKKAPILTKIIQENSSKPFSLQQFFDAFEIKAPSYAGPSRSTDPIDENLVLKTLNRSGMILQKQEHPNGCWTILCPWKHLHSAQDRGTKYYEPHTNGYSTHGFKCFHTHCESKTIHDLLSFLNIANDNQVEPLPLYRLDAAPRPFPMHALGPILEPAAETMHRIIQAPDSVCAQSVLAAMSLVTQPHANILIDGREIPLSEFYLTVAESGDRKSAVDKVALKMVSTWQESLRNQYLIDSYKASILQEVWEARKKEWLKAPPPQGSCFEEPLPTHPLRPLILIDEPTYEGIVTYFSANGQPNIGLFSDEGGRFFGGHGMKKDDRLKTIAGLSSLWDGKVISRMRSGDGEMLLYGKRLSLHLMIQEFTLSQIMNDPIFDAQGFLPRCLISFPESMAGGRIYVAANLDKEPSIQHFYNAINRLLDRPYPVNPLPELQNELQPRNLFLSVEAKKLWIAFHDKNETEIGKGKPYYSIRRFASKAPEHVLRLSGSLTLLENPCRTEIGIEYIQRGILLMDYYLSERLRIHGFASLNPELVCAFSLLKWLWKQGHDRVGLSTIYQLSPASLGLRTAENSRSIMSILSSHGWAIPTSNLLIRDKKHKEGWIIRPEAPEHC